MKHCGTEFLKHRFVSADRLIAISRSNRTVRSEDVQNFLYAKARGISVELFVRKNKDDKISKEFYYLGHMTASGNTREFPGGKIEPGETSTAALQREIREELNTRIGIDRYLVTVEYDYPEFHLSMDCFLCHVEEGDLTLLEHEAAKWLPLDNLRQVKWLPADIRVLEAIEEAVKG